MRADCLQLRVAREDDLAETRAAGEGRAADVLDGCGQVHFFHAAFVEAEHVQRCRAVWHAEDSLVPSELSDHCGGQHSRVRGPGDDHACGERFRADVLEAGWELDVVDRSFPKAPPLHRLEACRQGDVLQLLARVERPLVDYFQLRVVREGKRLEAPTVLERTRLDGLHIRWDDDAIQVLTAIERRLFDHSKPRVGREGHPL